MMWRKRQRWFSSMVPLLRGCPHINTPPAWSTKASSLSTEAALQSGLGTALPLTTTPCSRLWEQLRKSSVWFCSPCRMLGNTACSIVEDKTHTLHSLTSLPSSRWYCSICFSRHCKSFMPPEVIHLNTHCFCQLLNDTYLQNFTHFTLDHELHIYLYLLSGWWWRSG